MAEEDPVPDPLPEAVPLAVSVYAECDAVPLPDAEPVEVADPDADDV